MSNLEYRPPTFHWQEGWFFTRLEDGSVKIVKKEEATDEAKIIVEAIIPADEWASIIAYVSVKGETGENYREAQKFHKGGGG